MNSSKLNYIILECIQEVLIEEDPLYVEYHSQRQGEVPFEMGGTKYEYVNAIYPDGKLDLGVYSYAGDVVYSYNSFRQRMGIR